MFYYNSSDSRYNNVNICNYLVEADNTIQLGYLDVSVLNDVGAPIENALVTIYILDRFRGEAPVQIGLTDAKGKSPHFVIPIAYKISDVAGQELYFTTYNVRADAIGYYSAQTNNINFYPGVTSVMNYSLIPIPIKIPGLDLEQRVLLPPSQINR